MSDLERIAAALERIANALEAERRWRVEKGQVSSPEDDRVAAARHVMTDPVERELAESRGVDLDVVAGLLDAYDERLADFHLRSSEP